MTSSWNDVPITASGYYYSLADTTGARCDLKNSDEPHYIWSDNNLNIGADYHGSTTLNFKTNGNVERLRINSGGFFNLDKQTFEKGYYF